MSGPSLCPADAATPNGPVRTQVQCEGTTRTTVAMRCTADKEKRRALIIELQRLFVPEDLGRKASCGLCGGRFQTESIIAQMSTDNRVEGG